MKRWLIALRKVVDPQRDMFATLASGAGALPGMTPDAERYYRALYDHLIRISDLVDSYRDLLSGVLDTHLSTVSNRLNVVVKQLTIIATVFLPLSFLTGFFGQNFGWMVNRITSLPAFLGLGMGLQVAVTVALLVVFRRRGWLSADGATGQASHARPGCCAGSHACRRTAPWAQHGASAGAGRGQLGVKARVGPHRAQLGPSWSAPPRRQARVKRVTAH